MATPEQIEAELGRALEALRLAQNRSQAHVADEAGVSRRTITRLENGGGTSVDTLIRVMQALGVVDRLETLLPDASIRPVDRVRMRGRSRQRARMPATDSDDARESQSARAWKWNADD